MATSTKDYISVLNDLIETCKDGEKGFREAAEVLQNSTLRGLFDEYSRQRSQCMNELQREVTRLGGEPEQSGSVSATMHRGWINVKSAITGKDDHAILAEAERGEDAAVKAFQEALGKNLPADVRSIVERQYQKIQEAHRRIRSLRDGMKTSRTPDLETTRSR